MRLTRQLQIDLHIYTLGVLRARAAYRAEQDAPAERKAARAEYERVRYEKRKTT